MSKCLNKVELIGNLGRDPEHRKLENGTSVANFSLATSESWSDKKTGEKVEKVEWHRCVVWRGLADVVGDKLKKGEKVYVSGKLQTREYQSEGQTKYTTEVVVNDLIMFGNNNRMDQGEVVLQEASSFAPTQQMDSTDDLPF
tara:strand:- start:1183 stop:1608 length:426 start_codon:yes stop_codon:yes gene_type:complete